MAAGPWALCSPSCSKHQAKWGAAAWGLLDPEGCCGHSSVLREPDPGLQLRLDGFLPLIVCFYPVHKEAGDRPAPQAYGVNLLHTATLWGRALPPSG